MEIEIGQLKGAEWNTHAKEKASDGEFRGLVDSMREQGQIAAIVVRKVGDGYEIVDGHRRVQAAKELKLGKVRAEVVDLGDEEAMAATVTANIQRTDNDPILEAELFERLQKGGLCVGEIAATVGKSESYVVRRMRLVTLTDGWRKAAKKHAFTVDCLEHIAEYEREVQDSVHEVYLDEEECFDDDEVIGWSKFERQFTNRLMALDGRRFECSGCAECPYNTATHGFLFADMDGSPKCQKAACFKDKCDAEVDKKLESLKRRGVKVVEVSDKWHVSNYWSVTDRRTKNNTQPYVYLENGIRTLVWGAPKVEAAKVAKTKEEREAEKAAKQEERKRKQLVKEAVQKVAEALDEEHAAERIGSLSLLPSFVEYWRGKVVEDVRYYVSERTVRDMVKMAGGAEGVEKALGVSLTEDQVKALAGD